MAAFAPACKDKAPAPDSSREPSQAEAPQQQSPLPAEADVRAQLLPVLAPYPGVRLGEVQLDSSPGDQDALLITARVKTIIEENLYTRDDAPEILNEDRKAANEPVIDHAEYTHNNNTEDRINDLYLQNIISRGGR